ncbi:2-oxo acid dehydrogenase subunit E2 [Candidatus Acetothermia bacterium]|nr:2-oxo acid dehydrogenase subunit E2 [Candidatus Acetothermia bacterium]
MAFEFKLPDIGEGVHEGEIVKWLVKEGDTVKEDQPLVEVMTDKATVEIPSPKAGTVLKLMYKEGEVAKVGTVLVTIGVAGETAPAPTAKTVVAPAAQPTMAAAAATVAPLRTMNATVPMTAPGTRVLATPATRKLAPPATRKLARELRIDISLVAGSGPGGRVTDEDVRKFAADGVSTKTPVAPTPTPSPMPSAASKPTPASVAGVVSMDGREERMPLRGIRKKMSERMHQSKTTAAHFTYVDEIDMTELVKLREQMKPLTEKKNIKLTYLPFIVKACVAALKAMPLLNASLDEAKGDIVLKKYYNVGIAAATDEGLVVPVVKEADRKSLVEIAADIERLATTAREGKLQLHDIQGSTFTITSLGAMGGLFATPIINYPEVAILGVHEIKKRPVVRESGIVVRDIMLLSLSFDHRIVDGYMGAGFCKKIKDYLENPKLLFLEAA